MAIPGFDQSKHGGVYWPELDFYEILGIKPNAVMKDIIEARKVRIKELRPGITIYTARDEHQESSEEWQKVDLAYKVLSDIDKRKEYDKAREENPDKIPNYGQEESWPNYSRDRDNYGLLLEMLQSTLPPLNIEQQQEAIVFIKEGISDIGRQCEHRVAEASGGGDVRGYTLLHLAIQNGYKDIAKALIDKMTPEELAKQTKRFQSGRVVLDDTALHFAARKCDVELVSYLVHNMRQEDLGLQNHFGDTALQVATYPKTTSKEQEQVGVVEKLIEVMTEKQVNTQNNYKETALDIADQREGLKDKLEKFLISKTLKKSMSEQSSANLSTPLYGDIKPSPVID